MTWGPTVPLGCDADRTLRQDDAVTTPRRIIGITGCPGSGKSTIADRVAASSEGCIAVPMDGFHLAQCELERLGRAGRKGAPDTFDVGGYLALLRRIRRDEAPVYAPRFDRHLEEPIANAIAVKSGRRPLER